MKRLIFSVTGTIAGLVALLSFKTQAHPLAGSAPLPSAALGGTTSSTTPTPTSPTASAAGSSPAASSPAASSPAAQPMRKTYLGSAITTRYGIVQAKVTVAGGTITNASFAQLSAFDGHSQKINSWAGPQLLKETLTAQSANVDTVSGATYTSDGYVQSLQSALDEAGIK